MKEPPARSWVPVLRAHPRGSGGWAYPLGVDKLEAESEAAAGGEVLPMHLLALQMRLELAICHLHWVANDDPH